MQGGVYHLLRYRVAVLVEHGCLDGFGRLFGDELDARVLPVPSRSGGLDGHRRRVLEVHLDAPAIAFVTVDLGAFVEVVVSHVASGLVFDHEGIHDVLGCALDDPVEHLSGVLGVLLHEPRIGLIAVAALVFRHELADLHGFDAVIEQIVRVEVRDAQQAVVGHRLLVLGFEDGDLRARFGGGGSAHGARIASANDDDIGFDGVDDGSLVDFGRLAEPRGRAGSRSAGSSGSLRRFRSVFRRGASGKRCGCGCRRADAGSDFQESAAIHIEGRALLTFHRVLPPYSRTPDASVRRCTIAFGRSMRIIMRRGKAADEKKSPENDERIRGREQHPALFFAEREDMPHHAHGDNARGIRFRPHACDVSRMHYNGSHRFLVYA